MTIAELIKELKRFPQDMPICINENMDFVNSFMPTIKVEEKIYTTFPFTELDTFKYINLISINERED